MYGRNPGRYPGFAQKSTCWNEQGRKVIQRGFQQVLTKLESEMTFAGYFVKQLSSADQNQSGTIGPGPGPCLDKDPSAAILNPIREKVEGQQYDSLTDFRDDVWALSRREDVLADLGKVEQIQAFCDKEFEKAISEYPTFASLKSDSSEFHSIMAYSDSFSNWQQNIMELSMDLESKAVSSMKSSLGKRKPYWSIKEEEEFPQLLEKCGRDFFKIADHLKTKTINEIDQHLMDLISSGRTELLRLANAADARLQHESEIALSGGDERNVEPKERFSAQSPKVPVPEGIVYSAETLKAMDFYHLYQKDSSSGKVDTRIKEDVGNKKNPPTLAERSETGERSKRIARRPRRRALCPYCNIHKEGLHDEYALKKHYDRFHKATRQVWICDDISIDKQFLAKCKPCSAGKRYSTKHSASKHLRLSHFGVTASVEKLSRWIRKTEEPNPNFTESGPDALSVDTTRPFETWQGNKRQRTEGPLHLLQNPSLSNQSSLLPPMQSGSNKLSNSSQTSSLSATPNPHQDLQEDETGPSESSSEEEFDTIDEALKLPGISFDSFLPGASFALQSVGTTEPPHRTNLALIKPEQVDRLPHLDTFRKTACQDQVEALYRILDEQQVGGERYQEALEDLKSLSRTLLRNLMDWRRRSTLAPTIPFSI